MEQKGVAQFFEQYLQNKTIFKNKTALQSNYTPDKIYHRDEQLETTAKILAPLLRLEKPSNLFIYGKTGTGKTVTVRYVSYQLKKVAQEKNIPIKIIYINCKLKKVVDTEYRLIAQLIREFGKTIPPTGLPTDEVYNIFYSALDSTKQIVVIILDEIDQLVEKIGNEILYNLTRINSELSQSQLALVGISNDLHFTKSLDPRVKSSLSEEEIIFPPYNASQIQNILQQRCAEAFNDNSIEQGVIEKCAAYAAREHGDVRRALELIRVAGEIAERESSQKLAIKHLDNAEEKIEKDTMLDAVKNQPAQFQLTLYAIFKISQQKKEAIFTGEIYDTYTTLCNHCGIRPLTQRRVSDIIAEMDMLGMITAKVISKGRYGRTREISIAVSEDLCQKVSEILEEELGIYHA
ncbi:MAG: ORC1-type DNA replication protein [Candidatus Aenigmarchaeota archaeon]|nr:ORC1-type DNA replication protein [Candidatus Aenigmarchaeota archaeon]